MNCHSSPCISYHFWKEHNENFQMHIYIKYLFYCDNLCGLFWSIGQKLAIPVTRHTFIEGRDAKDTKNQYYIFFPEEYKVSFTKASPSNYCSVFF